MFVLVVIFTMVIIPEALIKSWVISTISEAIEKALTSKMVLHVLIHDRIWYGSDAAAGGWFFPHSSSRHLFPCPCCRLQWICHLRYQLFLQNCLDVHVKPGFVWRLSWQRDLCLHPLHFEMKEAFLLLRWRWRSMQTYSCIIEMQTFPKSLHLNSVVLTSPCPYCVMSHLQVLTSIIWTLLLATQVSWWGFLMVWGHFLEWCAL